MVTAALTRIPNLASGKLGRCARCMRVSLRGALSGWTAVAAVHVASLDTRLATVALLWASSFTVLWCAHIVTYARRSVASVVVTAAPSGGDAPPPPQGRVWVAVDKMLVHGRSGLAQHRPTRRQALGTFLKGSAAAVLASIARPVPGLGQGSSCRGRLCCCSGKCKTFLDCDCCNDGCCPKGYPFLCYNLNKCYPTMDAAKAACGLDWEMCFD